MKRNYTVLLLSIFIAMPAVGQMLNDAAIATVLKRMERDAGRQLPMGSPLSMVVAVQAGPGRMFTYRSVQTVPAYVWTASMKQHSRRIAINDYCTNPGLSEFKAQQVTVSWIVSDIDGRHVTTNTISASMCR